MNKSTNFSGQPVIKQLLKLLPSEIISRTAKQYNSDRYYKRFKTYNHLVTMLYATLSGVSSLRELSTILLACEGRITHLNLKHFPKRSTLSDANKNRSSSVFAGIYYSLYSKYASFLSDNSPLCLPVRHLKIVDSTTISLFSDILKGVGRNPINGKKKGGIKMHTMINALDDVPCLVRFSSASTHDHTFLKELNLEKGSFVVFDKAYNDYLQYLQWTQDDIYFVTRQKDNAVYKSIEEFDLSDTTSNAVLKDERIVVQKNNKNIELRRIAYWDSEKEKVYEFISNSFLIAPDKIADIYKHRWQIETMFKRLKQNFPLKYFLGDNQNAIEIQIWCGLIIQLLMLVIQRKTKRRWAYSNMVSMVRFYLMTYIDLFKFLENPNKQWLELTTKGILSTHLHSEGKYAEKLIVKSPSIAHWVPEIIASKEEDISYFPYMDGTFVFKHAVVRFSEVIMEGLAKNGLQKGDIDMLIPHQANLRIAQFIQKKFGLRNDQVFNNIMKYGNTTAASVIIALTEAWEEGKIKSGDNVVLAAFGSGFTWASAIIKWS